MEFSLSTKGFNDIIDITGEVARVLSDSDVAGGICLLSCPGSTCGFTTMEYEQGAVEDLKKTLENLVPQSKDYKHCKKWGDCNGFSHIRSALMKPFLALPVEKGELALGTWQQVVFLDFDDRPRERQIKVTIVKK